MTTNKELNDDDIILGKFILNQLPPVNSRCIRFFLCAPYYDTYQETCQLFNMIFFKLREFCMARYGVEFSAINLNWDVNENNEMEINLNNECLREIEKCKQQSIGMTFLSLIGDEYGGLLIPEWIEREQFSAILKCLKEEKHDLKILESFYKLNINFLSNRYELTTNSNKISPDVKNELLNLLKHGSSLAVEKNLLEKEFVDELSQSILEKQISVGALKHESKVDRVFCYVRLSSNSLTSNKNTTSHSIEYLRDKDVNYSIPAEQIYRIQINKIDNEYLRNFGLHYKKLFEILIDKFIQKHPVKDYTDLFEDILFNLNYIRLNKLSDISSDSQDILKKLTDYVLDDTRRQPLILRGAQGSGKTSIISTFASNLYLQLSVYENSLELDKHAVVVRFIGIDQKSTYLRPLLKSICQQLYFIKRKLQPSQDVEKVPNKLVELKKYFKKFLTTEFNRNGGKLVVIIESLHDLLKNDNCFKLDWLPNYLYRNCKLILSLSSDSDELIERVSRKYTSMNSYIDLTALSLEQTELMIRKFLNTKSYRLENEQLEIIFKIAKTKTLLSLQLKILSEFFLNWKSYTPIEDCVLHETLSESINYLLDNLEMKYGKLLVKHILSYISIAHSGLSENELQDILSLDDDLLKNLLSNGFIKPSEKFLRMPWVCILPLLNAISNHLLIKPFHGINTICWKHNIFGEIVFKKYLINNKKFLLYLHKNICEYYLGTWSNSRLKELSYEKVFNSRNDPDKLVFDKPIVKKYKFNCDRLIPAQPIKYDDFHTHIKPRYNLRKLIQLPYHLVKANMFDELFKNVFFNVEWLYSKITAFDLYNLIYDFDIYKNNIEVNLLCECLKFAENAIIEDSKQFYSQITGHLIPFYNFYKNIRHLIDQCDRKAAVINPLIPIGQIFNSPSWIYGECIDLGINVSDLQLDLLESDFNGRLLIAKNLNSTMVKFYDLDLFEPLDEIFTGKCSVYCNKAGDFLCTIEENNSFLIKRIENGEFYGKIEFNRCGEIGHVCMSNNYASIILRKVQSPLIVDLKSSTLLQAMPYHTSFSCISPDDRVLIVHSENSIYYHQLPSLKQIMVIDDVPEIPEKIIFTENNSNLFLLSKDTKQILNYSLNIKKKKYSSTYLMQDRNIVDMKLSNDESTLLICSTNCIYVFDLPQNNTECKFSIKLKLLSSALDDYFDLDEMSANESTFNGYGITQNNQTIFATIYTYLVCYDSTNGKVMRIFQSGLAANRIIKSYSSKLSNTLISLLDNNKLLVWNLNCFDHDKTNRYMKFEDMKVFNGSIDGCLLPKIEHNSTLNSNLVVTYSQTYPDAKILSLNQNLSAKALLRANPDDLVNDFSSSRIKQAAIDETGRYCYLENDLDDFEGKILPDEKDFIKKQCLIIDLKNENRTIESFTYIVRKKSAFRIFVKFLSKNGETYLLLKLVSCLRDFDPYSLNLDWTEFETVLKTYGPIEANINGLQLFNELKLVGESLENDLCVTNNYVFASLMHECNKLFDQEQPSIVKAKKYDVHLNIYEIFEYKHKALKVQLFSLNEFLSNDEYSNSNILIDLKPMVQGYLFLIYSKDGASRLVGSQNKYEYDYNEFKFERDIKCNKGAIIYDPIQNMVVKKFTSIFSKETNVERLLFATGGFYALDNNWNLFNLNSGQLERNMRKNLNNDFHLNFQHAQFLLNGRYIITCSAENDKIFILRSNDSFIVGSFKINDKICLISIGEIDRTILIGTSYGCLLPLKFVIDLEQSDSVENYIKYYRIDRFLPSEIIVESQEFRLIAEDNCSNGKSDQFERITLNNDIKRVVHSAHAYRQLKSKETRYSALSASRNSYMSTSNINNVHVGISKMNLTTISSGIKYTHSRGTKACLIQ